MTDDCSCEDVSASERLQICLPELSPIFVSGIGDFDGVAPYDLFKFRKDFLPKMSSLIIFTVSAAVRSMELFESEIFCQQQSHTTNE